MEILPSDGIEAGVDAVRPASEIGSVEDDHPEDRRYPGVGLRPLKFVRQRDVVGSGVSYRALVDYSEAPGSPVYAVTVTVPPPGKDQAAERSIKALLAEMRCDFLLREPFEFDTEPDDGEEKSRRGSVPAMRSSDDAPPNGSGEESRADEESAVLIELELIRFDGLGGTFGVVAIIRNSIVSADAAVTHVQKTVAGRPHQYWVRGKKKMHVTVTADRNRAWMSPPNREIRQGKSVWTDALTVTVSRAVNSADCTYTIEAKFNEFRIL